MRAFARIAPAAALAGLLLLLLSGLHAADAQQILIGSVSNYANDSNNATTASAAPLMTTPALHTASTAAFNAGSTRPWTWDWRTILALGCSVLISMVIAPGGSGGAQLYYPLFNVLLGFSIRETAAIVSFVMFLGAVMSCGMAITERHPTDPAARPLIDYGSVLIVAPAVLLGVAFGVIANAIVPLWLLQAASIAVFSWAFIKIMLPYLALRAKEKQRDAAAGVVVGEMRQVVIVDGGNECGSDDTAVGDDSTGSKPQQQRGAAAGTKAPRSAAGAAPTPNSTTTTTLASLEKQGDPVIVAAAAAALVADVLSRAPSTPVQQQPPDASDQIASDLRAFCTIDAQVRALEAAALDDYPLTRATTGSGIFSHDPDTLLMMAAVDAAPAAAANIAHRLQQRHGSVDIADVLRVVSATRAARAASASACVAIAVEPAAGSEKLPIDATAQQPAAAPSNKLASMLARVKAWGRRQPALLMVLTLAVLAQQLVFSVLQRAVVKACTGGFYGLLGARVAVTVIIAVGVSIIVTRSDTRNRQPAAPEDPQLAAAAVAESAASKPAGGKPSRAERRAVRAAAKEAAMRRNWEAILWRVRDIVEMNGAMLLIGVLVGCLGLGGGFATAPLLLSKGLHPQCQAGTSKAILLISTLASSVSFLIAGRLPLVYALVFGCINLLVTPIGIIAMNVIIKRTGKPSLLVALNALSYGAGVVLLLAMSGIPGWVATAKGQVPAGFQVANLCSS